MFRTTGGGNIMNQMPRIKIMGIGHGGSNALHGVIDTSISNVGYVAVADDKMLIKSGAESTMEISRGVISSLYQDGVLGTADRKALVMEIDKNLTDVDVLFLIASMGGAEGSVIAPLVAQQAKELGIATMVLVTKPFSFEGSRRMQKATDGIERLKGCADALLIVSNDILLPLMGKTMELKDGFKKINQYFCQEIKARCHLLTELWPSLNADGMKKILQNQGESFENFFLKN